MSNTEGQHRHNFPRCVQHIRNWEDRHLPLSQSRIAFDLFVLIGHSHEAKQPMTIKELFNSLKYSERGIRYVLDQFVDGGWCEIVGHDEDKRFRLVVATDLLRTRLREYQEHVMSVYRSHLDSVPLQDAHHVL
jgi:DNA-binding MarR family transcriptional regulator